MRAAALLPALLLAACVTRVAGSIVSFPARADWRECARERLEPLGYRVTLADSALEAAGARARLRLSADSTTLLRVEVSAAAGRPDVDSLVVYCGGAGG